MSLQVLDEKVNPLLGRREVRLIIPHSGAGTPDRVTVRKMASDHYKTSMEQVYVRSIATRTGGSNAVCVVEVYDKHRSKASQCQHLSRIETCQRIRELRRVRNQS